ncbi:hypothetical protein LPJ73_006874 [Coemansia sp. RSA 2703]|nr:hypothetical protein LPJ73_006874 [Coemansia sp. RSA 2703]
MGQAVGALGARLGSPSNGRSSNHYAGASFNNSPAPNTLPLPPSFLTSPTTVSPTHSSAPVMHGDEDVFGMGMGVRSHFQRQSVPSFPLPSGNVHAALDERARQLESMLGVSHVQSPPMMGQLASQSAVDLTQTGTDVASMFQKLRLIKEMSQQRAATVSPVSGGMAATVSFPQQTQQQLTPVYNA